MHRRGASPLPPTPPDPPASARRAPLPPTAAGRRAAPIETPPAAAAPAETAPIAAAPVGTGAPERFRTFASLRQRDFRWFYGAMLAQMAAQNMQMLVRGYLAYDLTESPAAIGGVALASAVPMLTLSAWGGVLADRMAKKHVVQGGQIASAVLALVMASLLLTDRLVYPHLVAAGVVQGTIMALMMPARQSMIPEVITRDRLMNAVSLNAAGMNLMRLLAPSAGGFLIASLGAGAVYLLMAGLYAAAMVTFLGMPTTPPGAGSLTAPAAAPAVAPAAAAPLPARRGGGWRDLGDGLRYVWREPTIFALLVVNFVTSLLAMPYLQLLPGFVGEVFPDHEAERLGLLIGTSGLGALVGALVLASLPERRRGLMLLGSGALIGVALLGFSQTASFIPALALMLLLGVGSAGRQALGNVLLQTTVTDAYRGRVMSIYMTQFSMMSFGTFAVSLVAEQVSVATSFAAMATLLVALTVLMAVLLPRVRHLD